MSSAVTYSEFTGEGLVQQRLLQGLQRGELPLVEAGGAFGFGFVHAGNPADPTAGSQMVSPSRGAVTATMARIRACPDE